MRLVTRLTATYAAVQAIFWIATCPILGFGSAYLVSLGFSSVDIGAMLAAANVIALAIQPPLSARSDADPRFTPARIVAGMAGIMLACTLIQGVLMGAGGTVPAGRPVAVLWTISCAVAIAAYVFVTSIKFMIDAQNLVDFGLCRAIGSLAWGATSAVLGFALERFGPLAIVSVVVAASCALLGLLAVCERLAAASARPANAAESSPSAQASSWPAFIRENRWLMVLLVGITLVYFHHALANYFSIVVVENVGGDSSDMGLIIALAAVLEIPGMVLFSRIARRVRTADILLFSLAGFALKACALWCAHTVPQLTMAFSLQLFSYGLFSTSAVAFAKEAARACDLVKSQTCFTLVTTLSAILSSSVGGVLFDGLGATATLGIAAIAAVAGLAISAVALRVMAGER